MPLAHVVTFTFSPDLPAGTLSTLADRLDELSAACPGIESYRHGPDQRDRPGNADYAVTAVFENEDAFTAYLTSPDHRRIVTELIGPHLVAKSSVQFPIPLG
ncbi:MAG: Dabb family protein [Rhodococcus sp. (in: high G+C Gram-positive bacteria)]|nr:MAG: Dabb family protein [Rhodococcus sp. (in: high G+C Gram-positive bacteria)]